MNYIIKKRSQMILILEIYNFIQIYHFLVIFNKYLINQILKILFYYYINKYINILIKHSIVIVYYNMYIVNFLYYIQ